MALVGLVGGVTALTIVAILAMTRLTKWQLQTETPTPIAAVRQLWAVSVAALVVVEIWPGIAYWLTSVFNSIL